MSTTPQPGSAASGVLKSVALFGSMSDSEVAILAARTAHRRYAAGELLFTEGEPCSGLYIVAAGRVRIFKTSPAGREQVLAIEGAGSSVAELPVFDGGSYPASASALEPSEILFVSRGDLRATCLEHPEMALKLLQVVGGRLRRLVNIIEELSFTTVRHRLISWLLRQARAEGRETDHGVVFTLSISQQEMAAQIGTVRELVTRNMTRLQSQGLIEVEGRQITIVDMEALQADLGPGP